MSADYDKCPTATCPRCGAEVEDHDGFGVLAHVQPYHADGCWYCSHPSRDGDGHGGWVCGICGDVRREVGTAPEIDSGPTCLDVVQTVEVGDTADVLLHPDCEYCYLYRCDECHAACGVAPHVSSTSPLSVHSTGLAMDVNPDDCPRDVVEDFAVLYARRVRWIPRKMCRIEKVRWVETGAQLRHNQWRREYARPMRKRMKRLSAMRRQCKGG